VLSDRYKPPQTPAPSGTGPGDSGTVDRPKRPFAVSAFQVLLVLLCALSLLKSVRLAIWLTNHHGESSYENEFALRLAWTIFCSLAAAGGAYAIHKAMRFARYLGWFIFAVLICLEQIDMSAGVPAQYSVTPAMRGGYEAASGLWEIILVIWALRFGLGGKAKRYFGVEPVQPR